VLNAAACSAVCGPRRRWLAVAGAGGGCVAGLADVYVKGYLWSTEMLCMFG